MLLLLHSVAKCPSSPPVVSACLNVPSCVGACTISERERWTRLQVYPVHMREWESSSSANIHSPNADAQSWDLSPSSHL